MSQRTLLADITKSLTAIKPSGPARQPLTRNSQDLLVTRLLEDMNPEDQSETPADESYSEEDAERAVAEAFELGVSPKQLTEAAEEETKLSHSERRKRDKIVEKHFKPKMGDFEKRYGKERAKQVAYAVATSIAKKDRKHLEEDKETVGKPSGWDKYQDQTHSKSSPKAESLAEARKPVDDEPVDPDNTSVDPETEISKDELYAHFLPPDAKKLTVAGYWHHLSTAHGVAVPEAFQEAVNAIAPAEENAESDEAETQIEEPDSSK